MRLLDYKEDLVKHESGSPYYLGDGCFYVKRFGTVDSSKQIEEIKLELYGFSPKEIDNNLVLAHWLCEYGVTGWDDILNEDDEQLPYSKSNARRVFLNPAFFLGINSLLIDHACSYKNYLYDEVEEDIEAIKKN